MSKQNLDDAQAKYDSAAAQTLSFLRTYDLVKLGPRKEDIDAAQGLVEQAKGQLALAETQLANTVIRAPVTGTILERNVEIGEFVTTGMVGDKGAKGYVVSMADLNDLKVELDINQNDFAKLGPHAERHRDHRRISRSQVRRRDRRSFARSQSPEGDGAGEGEDPSSRPVSAPRDERQRGFSLRRKPVSKGAIAKPSIVVPLSAVRSGSVFVIAGGRAVKRTGEDGGDHPLPGGGQGVFIEDGLIGGEDLIVNPPADLKDGDRVKQK
jgi:HlyD family secretion protein